MVESEDVNIAHREYFPLNDDFEDILDPLVDNKKEKTILKKYLNQ